jgi:hypothetical protein
MSVSFYAKLVGCLLAGALALPAASRSTVRTCAVGTPTPQSYTWNFRQEAQGLLGDVGVEAYRTSYQADQLQNFSPDIDWQDHADALNAIRDQVNDMGTQLCRLETIKRVVSPWERKAINDAAPLITEMSNEAQAAITYLNHNHNHLFNPAYHAYSEEMYQQSTRLTQQMNELENFGKVHQNDLRLEKHWDS